MKRVLFMLICLVSAALAAETWTNRAGRSFKARLVSVGDSGAVFVFHEDGATNTLSFEKLSSESAERACNRFGYVPIPPKISATYNRALSDLQRIENQVEDGLLTAGAAADRRKAVFSAFSGVCRNKGIGESAVMKLIKRLEKDIFPSVK